MQERTPEEVLALVKDEGCEFVDLRFSDLPGVMQHVTIPAHVLSEDHFSDGHGFDGSSVRGFQEIQESDMVLVTDPNTAYMDPFMKRKTMVIHCYVADPVTGESYTRDPRYVAQKAEAYLQSHRHRGHRLLRPRGRVLRLRRRALRHPAQRLVLRGRTRSRASGTPGPKSRAGTSPTSRAPSRATSRSRRWTITRTFAPTCRSPCTMWASRPSCTTTRSASGGQGEIGIKFDTLLAMADKLMTFKYILKNVAWQARQVAHLHAQADLRGQRLGHAHPPVALEGRRAALLRRGRLRRSLRHGPLVHRRPAAPRPRGAGLHQPDHEQLQRLVPGYEAPVNLVYGQRNRSASCRIPMTSQSPKAKRIEFRCPDSTSNPYLAFSAMMLAGLDGIQNRIEPPTPVDKDIYDLPPEELALVPQVPATLEAALDALEADNDFLKAGGVFTDDLIDTWVAYKRTNEIDAIRLRPHPYEFSMYYDI